MYIAATCHRIFALGCKAFGCGTTAVVTIVTEGTTVVARERLAAVIAVIAERTTVITVKRPPASVATVIMERAAVIAVIAAEGLALVSTLTIGAVFYGLKPASGSTKIALGTCKYHIMAQLAVQRTVVQVYLGGGSQTYATEVFFAIADNPCLPTGKTCLSFDPMVS